MLWTEEEYHLVGIPSIFRYLLFERLPSVECGGNWCDCMLWQLNLFIQFWALSPHVKGKYESGEAKNTNI